MPPKTSEPRRRLSKAARALSKDMEAIHGDSTLSFEESLDRLALAVKKHLLGMTKMEQSEIMDSWGRMLYGFEKELASQGLTRPGNNPDKPN